MVIYKPKGKAKEYCNLAVNLYSGCDHGCLYCYAPKILRTKYQEFIEPKTRKDILQKLEKEAKKFTGHEVLLCFTCDPYCHYGAKSGVTRKAIQILHNAGVNVVILTKGGRRSMTDFDLLTQNDKYGATLTFINDIDSKKWEPYAALPKDRMFALQKAHKQGIKTWVSLEPVIDPLQTLKLIELTHEFVDIYKVGRWNYDKRANEIDYKEFVESAINLFVKYGKKYLIKKDLGFCLSEPEIVIELPFCNSTNSEFCLIEKEEQIYNIYRNC